MGSLGPPEDDGPKDDLLAGLSGLNTSPIEEAPVTYHETPAYVSIHETPEPLLSI